MCARLASARKTFGCAEDVGQRRHGQKAEHDHPKCRTTRALFYDRQCGQYIYIYFY
jgi:hypothetical protein